MKGLLLLLNAKFAYQPKVLLFCWQEWYQYETKKNL